MTAINRAKIRFRERAELLDFLLEAAALTSETIDLDEMLANVAKLVTRLIPAELFAILLYNDKQKGLRIRHSIGYRADLTERLIIPIGEGITGIAAASKQPVLVGDVQSDPRYLPALDAVRSELAVPMLTRGKLVGVIDLQSTVPNGFTAYDRSILQLLAARVASSIANARLYRRVDRQNRLLKTLSAATQEITSILALDELLRRIAQIVRTLVNYDAFSVLLVDERRKVLRHQFSLRYDQRVELDNVPLGSGITGAAVAARDAVRVNDTATDPRYIASHPGIQSEVAVPLILQNRAVGAINLESEKLGFFTEDHTRMLTLLAPYIANAVENARLYQELATREHRMDMDLRAARKLQKVLLPRHAPEVDGLSIALGARPAREISGDIYDFFLRDKQLLFCFGDSSGKGAAAALYGALVSGVLRSFATSDKCPGELMAELNETLLERKVEAKYVTLLVALWNPPARTLRMTNAGGIPPIVCRGDQMLTLHAEGVPVGLLEDQKYDELVFQAEPGDVIVFYSDGVSDQQAMSADGQEAKEYGTRRLERLLKRSCELPGQEIVGAIFEDLDQFAGGAPINDDQTLVVMKVH